MRIHAAFLANYAENPGLLYVCGAFPEWWNVTSLPTVTTLCFVIVHEMEHEERDDTFTLGLTFNQPDGSSNEVGAYQVRRGEGSGEWVAGAPILQTFVLRLTVAIEDVGVCSLDLKHEGVIVATVRFAVRLKPD